MAPTVAPKSVSNPRAFGDAVAMIRIASREPTPPTTPSTRAPGINPTAKAVDAHRTNPLAPVVGASGRADPTAPG